LVDYKENRRAERIGYRLTSLFPVQCYGKIFIYKIIFDSQTPAEYTFNQCFAIGCLLVVYLIKVLSFYVEQPLAC